MRTDHLTDLPVAVIGRNASPRSEVVSQSVVAKALSDSPSDEIGTSIGKAIALLTAFDRRTPIGVSELARSANLTKSTAFRLLGLLSECQLVERAGSRYRLGVKLFELGNRVEYCCPHSLRELAHPFLEDLYEATHETIHLAVLDGEEVLYLDKIFGHNRVKTPSHVGARLPAHCTALGKALLAHSQPETIDKVLSGTLAPITRYTIVQPSLLSDELDQVSDAGVAFDHEEVGTGVICVAVPVFDRRGELVAAISIAGASWRFHPEAQAHRMKSTAAALGRNLHGSS